jgi:hypothetical protein
MNSIKKVLLAGLLMPGMAGAMGDIKKVADTLKQGKAVVDPVRSVINFGKGVPGVNKLAADLEKVIVDVEKYATNPAYELGVLLSDLERMQAEFDAAASKLKSVSNLALCAAQSAMSSPDKSATRTKCEAVSAGCTSQVACAAEALANINIMLNTLYKNILGQNGVIQRFLGIIQQQNAAATIQTKVADPFNKALKIFNDAEAQLKP